MPKLIPTVKLNNGQHMPSIGFGTWRSNESDAERSVKDAIDIGYRHIDTAFMYENEHEVGSAINAKLAEGVIKREDIFVVTKLAGVHHNPDIVEHACRTSLKNLNLSYIDQYLIHFPVGQEYVSDDNLSGPVSNVDYVDTWQAMEKLVDLGLVRGIGLSNFNSDQIQRVLDIARIKPVVNQVECHPGFNQKKLIEFCKRNNIVVTAYCPLARPKPAQQWPPFLYDGTAQKLAEKYGKTSAQICLRYLIQIGTIPIPKSVSKNRIAENYDVFDFKLTEEDIGIMDQYHNGLRTVTYSGLSQHKYFPFNTEF
ncbi:1,5-anhydro-D-fructose reductase-like [Teleopsis dalmanni]|uniref:1,5-anhydro-D-fructose reductase-like n=1 Tax=Teleopsis dalmanni TaxID=139649 RepID=UPI0018CE954A|nr:1,5-anhydro-D-fructose reductase-like [Teleopsis dalmanni]XP_037947749.1 1,5-anhydro-D-fructose reductase-like [Teleopsis dalmanni]